MNLNTSVAVVFGAARGIGLGYARVLLENGVKVSFRGRSTFRTIIITSFGIF